MSACANQTSPTGGPKDEEPPVLESSSPGQGQLNFKGNKIVLDFNEYVKTDKAKELILITPTLDQEFDIKYRKQRVIIEFEKPLADSTTYSINFRESIQDITENNPVDNLILAFSTGPYLDSLSLSGNVTELMTGASLEDITVSLYAANDTLDVFNSPPIYLTKSNKEGLYEFRNLKNGQYHAYAIDDQNKNLTLDSKSEMHGFRSAIVPLDTNIVNIDIPLLNMDVRPFALQSARQSGTTYNIKYNKYIQTYSLHTEDSLISVFSGIQSKIPTTIQVYNTLPIQDSLRIVISAFDSTNTQRKDTIYLKFEETQRKSGEFTTQTEFKPILTTSPNFELMLNFNKPIFKINTDSLYIFLDSANIAMLSESNLNWDKHKNELNITYSIDPALFVQEETRSATASERFGQKATDKSKTRTDSLPPKEAINPYFYAAKGTFISAESDSSDQIKKNLTFTRPNQLGALLVQVQTTNPSYFIQLLDKQNKVIDEKYNIKTSKFENIPPGEYKIRVLVDSNKNGYWEPGNILLNEEPEPVFFYETSEGSQILKLRANWELGPNVITF